MTSDLMKRLLDPGFTPGKTHLDELWGLLAGQDEKLAEAAEKALLRVGAPLGQTILERLPQATSPQRGRLARLLGKLAAHETGASLRPQLIALLDDPDAKTRRNAIIALGKAPLEGAEEALLARWTEQTPVEQQRSIAASLGKIGGSRSLDRLKCIEHDDPELRRIVAQSALMLARTLEREQSVEANILGSAQASEPLHVVARCRRGLEALLLEELESILLKPAIIAPGQVRGVLEGPLDKLFGARVMMSFSLLLKPVPIHDGDLPGALAAALTSREAKLIFSTFTEGQVRYRIDWQEGGHRRGLTWMCARRVEQADPSLRNDPTGSNWEVFIAERDGSLRVELTPKAIDDPRFRYRTHDVPAASHPTIAAALARVAGVKEHDVVWDPFVGSGLELCERAKLGPYQKLYGTDVDPVALDAARANLQKAGVKEVTLIAGDSRQQRIAGLSLVISNPPMGRRVARREGVESLLLPMIENVAAQLVPGGRLVWLSPLPDATAHAGERAGLAVRRGPEVDMGGFWTELQVMTAERPAQRRPSQGTRRDFERGGRGEGRGGEARGPAAERGRFERGGQERGRQDRGGRGGPERGGPGGRGRRG